MASVTSLGSGSGLDLESLVTKLVSAESVGLTRLQTKESTYNSKISNIGKLTSLVSTLQGAVQALQDASKIGGVKASSSNTSAFTVSATSAASVSSHSVDVLQLAQGQRLVTNSGSFTSSSDALSSSSDGVASAKLTINFGTIGTDGSLSVDSSKTAMTVDVTPDSSGNITLASVRDAINAKGGAVTASLVKESDSSTRLVLTNSTTGASNAFSVDVALKNSSGTEIYNSATTGSTTTTGFSKLAYHPGSSSSYTVKQSAADAHIALDGVDVYRSSNTITDLLDNVTLTLTGTTIPSGSTTSQAATLSVASDSSDVSTLLQNFVSAYNGLQTTISSLTSYNASTKAAGALQGDSTVRTIQTQLRSMLTGKFGASGNSIATLSDLGLSFQTDGTLKLDSTKLTSAVSNHIDQIQSFFGSYDKTKNATTPESAKTGLSYKLNQLVSGMLGNTGLIQTKIDGLKKSVKTIDNQITREQNRLTQVEALYRKQFTSLDTAISNMKSLSTSLTSQLASLPGVVSSNSNNS